MAKKAAVKRDQVKFKTTPAEWDDLAERGKKAGYDSPGSFIKALAFPRRKVTTPGEAELVRAATEIRALVGRCSTELDIVSDDPKEIERYKDKLCSVIDTLARDFLQIQPPRRRVKQEEEVVCPSAN